MLYIHYREHILASRKSSPSLWRTFPFRQRWRYHLSFMKVRKKLCLNCCISCTRTFFSWLQNFCSNLLWRPRLWSSNSRLRSSFWWSSFSCTNKGCTKMRCNYYSNKALFTSVLSFPMYRHRSRSAGTITRWTPMVSDGPRLLIMGLFRFSRSDCHFGRTMALHVLFPMEDLNADVNRA